MRTKALQSRACSRFVAFTLALLRSNMLASRICRSAAPVQASAALRSRVARESYLRKLARPADLVSNLCVRPGLAA